MIKEYLDRIYRNKEVFVNFIWRALQIFGKQGINMIIFFLCLKMLPPESLGIYTYTMAGIMLLGMIADFGVASAVSKFVAEYAVKDKKKINDILYNSVMVVSVVGIVLVVLTLLFGKLYFQDKYTYVLYALPIIVIYPITSLLDGIYTGLRRFKEVSMITLSLAMVSIVYFYLLVKHYGVTGAIVSQDIFYLTLLLILFFRCGIVNKFTMDLDVVKEVTTYSVIIGLASVGNFFYTRVDILVLGKYGLISEVAYYEIIYRIFTLMWMPVSILGTVVAPSIVKRFALKQYDGMFGKIFREAVLLFIMGLLLSVVVYFATPIVFRTFFQQYDVGFIMTYLPLLLILVPLRYFSTYISVAYIVPSGKALITSISLIIFGIVNLILDIIFISRWGFIGCIYSTLVAQIALIIFKDGIFLLQLKKMFTKTKVLNA